jgi:hypothetical protein
MTGDDTYRAGPLVGENGSDVSELEYINESSPAPPAGFLCRHADPDAVVRHFGGRDKWKGNWMEQVTPLAVGREFPAG